MSKENLQKLTDLRNLRNAMKLFRGLPNFIKPRIPPEQQCAQGFLTMIGEVLEKMNAEAKQLGLPEPDAQQSHADTFIAEITQILKVMDAAAQESVSVRKCQQLAQLVQMLYTLKSASDNKEAADAQLFLSRVERVMSIMNKTPVESPASKLPTSAGLVV